MPKYIQILLVKLAENLAEAEDSTIMKQSSMTSGSIVRILILFTLPLLVGNIFQQFYSMADTFIVGRTIGVDALAAVGCTGSITFLIIGFAQGFTSGLSIRVAQRYGAGDEEGVRRGIACGALLSLAATVVLTVMSCALTRTILLAMNTPAEILEQAYDYLIVIFAGTGTTILFNYVSNISRALGDSRTPLIFLVVACIINIALDYFLILQVGMNVEGAAYATIAAQLFSGVACLLYMIRRFPQMRLHRSDWVLSGDSLSHALALALPMGFQMSVIALGQIAVQFALNGLGSVYVAAFTASQKIDNMAIQPAISFGVGISTFAAQNYGAGKIHRIRKGILQCCLLSGGFSILIGAVIVLFGKNLVALFVGAGEIQVIDLANTYLIINGSLYAILAVMVTLRSALQGLGQGGITTFGGMMELAMRTVVALAFTGQFGFLAVCVASPMAWVGALIPLAVYAVRYLHRLALENPEPVPGSTGSVQ